MPLIDGYEFDEDESVTGAKLKLQFTRGGVTGIKQESISDGVIVAQPAAPTAAVGRAWADTSQGNGRVHLRIFDGFDWTSVAEGFIGYNASGVTIGAGAPVLVDSSAVSQITGSRVQIIRTTAQTQNPLGVALGEILNGAFGIIITKGKAKAIKDGTAVTAGDCVVPSATAAQVTTGVGSTWGHPFGSRAMGVFLETSSASAGTLVDVFLFGPNMATWTAYKSTPLVLVNSANPSALATWQTAVSWSTSPVGVIAHLAQIRVTGSGASTNVGVVFGMRPNGSTKTISDGMPFLGGTIQEGADDANGLYGQLWVPASTSDDKFQWYFDSAAGAITNAEATVTIWECAIMVGGEII